MRVESNCARTHMTRVVANGGKLDLGENMNGECTRTEVARVVDE